MNLQAKSPLLAAEATDKSSFDSIVPAKNSKPETIVYEKDNNDFEICQDKNENSIIETAAILQPPFPKNIERLMYPYITSNLPSLVYHFFPDKKVITDCANFYFSDLKILIEGDGSCFDYCNSQYYNFVILLAFQFKISIHAARIAILEFLSKSQTIEILDYFADIVSHRKRATEKNYPIAHGIRRYIDDYEVYDYLIIKCPYCGEEHVHGDRSYTLRQSHCTRLPGDDFEVGGEYLLGDIA